MVRKLRRTEASGACFPRMMTSSVKRMARFRERIVLDEKGNVHLPLRPLNVYEGS